MKLIQPSRTAVNGVMRADKRVDVRLLSCCGVAEVEVELKRLDALGQSGREDITRILVGNANDA